MTTNQKYKLENANYDSKNKVSLIDMEIFSNTGSLTLTWRVKNQRIDFLL